MLQSSRPIFSITGVLYSSKERTVYNESDEGQKLITKRSISTIAIIAVEIVNKLQKTAV